MYESFKERISFSRIPVEANVCEFKFLTHRDNDISPSLSKSVLDPCCENLWQTHYFVLRVDKWAELNEYGYPQVAESIVRFFIFPYVKFKKNF